jgi:pyruvate ferredoxin oxidoreductase gamma subunit/phenylglyoxylate dehydrogenase gamma subunit
MPEIRIHGRGGQGTVLAAKILAKALVEEGKYTMAIPAFGFERRGAPVVAFLRYEDHEIRAVTNIYNPNIIMCIDPSIATVVDIFEGISDHATLVQASKKPIGEIVRPETVERVGLCDAVGIALDVFSKQITNTIMLGAFARTTGVVTLDSLKKGLSVTNFRDAGLEQNMIAIERGYNETTVYDLTKEAAA